MTEWLYEIKMNIGDLCSDDIPLLQRVPVLPRGCQELPVSLSPDWAQSIVPGHQESVLEHASTEPAIT